MTKKTKKVVVNGEEVEPIVKVKLWEQDGYSRHKVRELIIEKREKASKEDGK